MLSVRQRNKPTCDRRRWFQLLPGAGNDIILGELISLARGTSMAAVTVRNLSDETHKALKKRAAAHGRSTEAEIRSILEEAVSPLNGMKLGTYLFEKTRELGGIDLDVTRDKTPVRSADFE
jgi:plasmid stability protein